FRSDLYFRLATVDLALPPLRARREDIALLHSVFMRRAAERFGLPLREMPPAVLSELESRLWPGNVRELKAHAERAVIGMDRAAAPPEGHVPSLPEQVAAFEAGVIARALEQTGGSS